MTPAAMQAKTLEDLLVASIPGGIEAQEKQGQVDESSRQTLPSDMRGQRFEFEKVGFEFGEVVDGIFIEAKFPEGWSKRPTDHSMWTEIVDTQGRVRGQIFYKAAFYDRSAHAHLVKRFIVSDDYGDEVRTISVEDRKGEVEKKITGLLSPNYDDSEEALQRNKKIEEARNEIGEWLNENYPGWESPLAYWDEEDED